MGKIHGRPPGELSSPQLLHLVTYKTILSSPIVLVYENMKIIDLLNDSQCGTIDPSKDRRRRNTTEPAASLIFTLTYEKEAFIRAYFRTYPTARSHRDPGRSF